MADADRTTRHGSTCSASTPNHPPHRHIAVEDDVDETRRGGENVGNQRERELSEQVTGEGGIALDKTLRAHIVECCFLSDDQSNLGKLGGTQEIGMAGRITLGANVDVREEKESWCYCPCQEYHTLLMGGLVSGT